MDNLEGFPGRTCPGISYRRWILFPSIFKSYASTTHQPLVSAQQGWELRRGGVGVTPAQALLTLMGRRPTGSDHGRQSRVLVTGSMDSHRQDGVMRLHPGVQKHRAEGCSMGPKSIQKTAPKTELSTSYSICMRSLSRRQATDSPSQSRSQGQRQAAGRYTHSRVQAKSKGPGPSFRGVLGQRQRGCAKVPLSWAVQLRADGDLRVLTLPDSWWDRWKFAYSVCCHLSQVLMM